MIELVTAEADAAREAGVKGQIRDVIRANLRRLAADLKQFPWTTHGCIGGGDIDRVAEALVVCFESPRAYTVSDLGQVIHLFLKEPL